MSGEEAMKFVHLAAALMLVAAPMLAHAKDQTPKDQKVRPHEDKSGAQWAAFGGTTDEDHYSPLTQINDTNAGRVGLAWYTDLGQTNSFSSPIEVDGVIYFATGFSVLHAMDARTGKELWSYDPEVYKYAGDKMRAGWPIRGVAYDNGRVFAGTLDGRLIAVDAKTGKLVWATMTTDPSDERYVSGTPWVFNGKVAIGHGGSDNGPFRGYITAYDQRTGKRVWRFYTVPGNPADGFENKAMEMAAKTWKGEWWKWGGGGSVWQAMAFDPKLNLLYFGTGNGFPWNQKIRSPGGGDNLFVCSIVAVNADTGEYVWHYQINPGESWDYNAAMDIELADLTIDGKLRHVLMQAPKNGFYYVIDRTNGKLISAEKIAKNVNWAERIDLKTGRPVENPAARYPNGQLWVMAPSSSGAHSIAAMSVNPNTAMAYVPLAESFAYYIDPPDIAHWQPVMRMVVNTGVGAPPPDAKPLPPRTTKLVAWDILKQKQVWEIPLKGWENGGTFATAGNIVLQGQSTGEVFIVQASTGKKLWSFDAQNAVMSNPITYMLDGKQYITVVTGYRNFTLNDPPWDFRLQKRRVLTFVLDGKVKLPPADNAVLPVIDDPKFKIDAKKAEYGGQVFNAHCFVCHGYNALAGGAAPDLRKSDVPLSLEAMTEVIRGGALMSGGMPQFEEFTDADLEGIQHYIRLRARQTMGTTPTQ
jgi:quinohemoprotein ethanol dehydrogenase